MLTSSELIWKLHNRVSNPNSHFGKLQAFESAAHHGSVTQAGRELNLTQSTVSRQIRELEAQLGIALFERARQRVVLSDAGRKLLPDARKLLEQGEATMLRILKLDRLRIREPNGARDEFHLAAAAQNLRKLAKLIPMPMSKAA
ncbi:DNA-binding transcriptional LysR family regulator [Mesorhizobium soli]|uniref:LysR family transcriptional regulator n=1 Tax=Pseudaminobacter soli (ex Li et al. 2025) TaxID=1295366 RepID=UPI00247DEE04|nr:DNA-binding transcriptional LysR family regulator [Mesorhizobium soli]